jgi:hypothetical protein
MERVAKFRRKYLGNLRKHRKSNEERREERRKEGEEEEKGGVTKPLNN